MLDPIVYEHPLNERIRHFLRLERLFMRIGHHSQLNSHWDSQACIRAMLELLELTSRGDLKTEIMKELERQHLVLKPLANDPGVNNDKLNSILERQQSLLTSIYDSDGKLTTNLRNDELLSVVQQRACVAGGGCDFDLPAYHRWLNTPLNERLEQFHQWIAPYDHVKEGIAMCLEVLRLSSNNQQLTAEQGFYDQSLDPSQSVQLIRIIMAPHLACYPEISGGKQRFTVRFSCMENTSERPVQSKEDINFSLQTCGL